MGGRSGVVRSSVGGGKVWRVQQSRLSVFDLVDTPQSRPSRSAVAASTRKVSPRMGSGGRLRCQRLHSR